MESKRWLKDYAPKWQKDLLEKTGEHYYTKEPILHSHVSDLLDDEHHLAFEHVSCGKCKTELLHASNNECMQTWIETEFGNFCTKCWNLTDVTETLEDNLKVKEIEVAT